MNAVSPEKWRTEAKNLVLESSTPQEICMKILVQVLREENLF